MKKRGSGAATKATWHCDKCNYLAMYESELERHKRLHKNIKPFKCIFCDYNSSWKSDLKRHYEGHHKDRLGDEKRLNSIMNCYQNNAGTQMEVQSGVSVLDKTRLPILLLSPTDQSSGEHPPRPPPALPQPPLASPAAPVTESVSISKSTPSPPALKLGRPAPMLATQEEAPKPPLGGQEDERAKDVSPRPFPTLSGILPEGYLKAPLVSDLLLLRILKNFGSYTSMMTR